MRLSDIKAFASEPRRMTIMRPGTRAPLCDVDGNPGFIDLYSRSRSSTYRQTQEERFALWFAASLRPQRHNETDDEIEAREVLILAEITKAWCLVGLDGARIDEPCTWTNAKEIYADVGLGWLRQQVVAFTNNVENWKAPVRAKASPGGVALAC